MDVLGMVLENVQLYESSRQEAKRSQVATQRLFVVHIINPSMFMHSVYLFVFQALIEMAQVLSKEHHSFEVMLSKMAATIMPFTHAQYCAIFIPSAQTSVTKDQVDHQINSIFCILFVVF